MKLAIVIGLASSAAGLMTGLYFSLSAIFEELALGQVSEVQAGIHFANTGLIVGIAFALAGITSNHFNKLS